MSNNCLVTKLNVNVQNDDLEILGAMKSRIKLNSSGRLADYSSVSPYSVLYFPNNTVMGVYPPSGGNERIDEHTVRLKGQYGSNYIQLDSSTNDTIDVIIYDKYYFSYILPSMKKLYGGTENFKYNESLIYLYVRADSDNNKNIFEDRFNLDDFQHLDLLEEWKTPIEKSDGITIGGDFINFLNRFNVDKLKTFEFKYKEILDEDIDFADYFGKFTKLERISLHSMNHIVGSFEDFVVEQVNATSNPRATCTKLLCTEGGRLGSITFDGTAIAPPAGVYNTLIAWKQSETPGAMTDICVQYSNSSGSSIARSSAISIDSDGNKIADIEPWQIS